MPFKETCKTIQSVDLATLMSWVPCYSESKILSLTDGRESLSAEGVNQLGIPVEDRYWVLVHMLSDYQKHILACEIAESALAADSDPRSLAAPAAKRAWLRGEISDEELFLACRATQPAYSSHAADEDPTFAVISTALFAVRPGISYYRLCRMAITKIKEDK